MHEHVFDFSAETQAPANDTCKIILNNILFNDLLVEHIYWYCRFRWIVTRCFFSSVLSSFIDDLFKYLNMRHDLYWPFAIAGTAIIINILFKLHADRLRLSGHVSSLIINMWTQIFLDLVILTMVVHYVGSLDTVISFAYLFHTVLSCIFFSRVKVFWSSRFHPYCS